MFLGKYTIDNKIYNYIYIKNNGGWLAWQNDTFSPDTQNQNILDFSVRGRTYAERKADAREKALIFQYDFACLPWSYGELGTIGEQFEKIGKRYGLIKEFKENGIL
jgi:hypothetical protein